MSFKRLCITMVVTTAINFLLIYYVLNPLIQKLHNTVGKHAASLAMVVTILVVEVFLVVVLNVRWPSKEDK